MNFLTADTHFFHKNILGYCNRPFPNVIEMNLALIERWRSVAKPEDTVYHLGDFSFGDMARSSEILKMLPGKKILIRGNHDKSRKRMLEMGFDEVYPSLELDGWLLVHRPPVPVHPMKKVLCGHVHDKWKRRGNMINVGCDVWNFTPITMAQIEACPVDSALGVNDGVITSDDYGGDEY
jgi:calcineurin-like phosphoesterase family protein